MFDVDGYVRSNPNIAGLSFREEINGDIRVYYFDYKIICRFRKSILDKISQGCKTSFEIPLYANRNKATNSLRISAKAVALCSRLNAPINVCCYPIK